MARGSRLRVQIYNTHSNFLLQNCKAQCLKLGMYYFFAVVYQADSNGGPSVQNDPAPGASGFEPWQLHRKIEKSIYFRTSMLRCLEFGKKHCLVDLYQFV